MVTDADADYLMPVVRCGGGRLATDRMGIFSVFLGIDSYVT